MSSKTLDAPILKRFGVSHSSPNCVLMSVIQLRTSSAVLIPPAGLKPI